MTENNVTCLRLPRDEHFKVTISIFVVSPKSDHVPASLAEDGNYQDSCLMVVAQRFLVLNSWSSISHDIVKMFISVCTPSIFRRCR